MNVSNTEAGTVPHVSKKEQKAREVEEAKEHLRRWIKPGQRVYTSLEHVSSTGMSRRIRVYVVTPSEHEVGGHQIYDATYFTAKACGYRFNSDKHAIVIGGAGMDMGYSIVYSLSSVLYRGNFKCIGEGCPSNDHTNDRDGSWSRENNKGREHSDGGYALTHSWL